MRSEPGMRFGRRVDHPGAAWESPAQVQLMGKTGTSFEPPEAAKGHRQRKDRQMFMQTGYDWVGDDHRTKEAHPYSFSAHYIFRDGAKTQFGIKGAEGVYTDRMRSWDAEKWDAASNDFGFFRAMPKGDPRKTCQKAAEIYFGEGTKCVGYALCCNVSSGYPIGIFFIKRASVT